MNTFIDSMLDFANTDIEALPENSLTKVLLAYTTFVTHNAENRGVFDFTEKFSFYMKKLGKNPEKLRDFLEYTNDILNQKLDFVLKEKRIFKDDLPGNFLLCCEENIFKMKFVADPQFKDKKILVLYKEADLLYLALIDLLADHVVYADRLKRCPECNKYFYQPTAREKTYCSNKCGHVLRQRKKYNPAKKILNKN